MMERKVDMYDLIEIVERLSIAKGEFEALRQMLPAFALAVLGKAMTEIDGAVSNVSRMMED